MTIGFYAGSFDPITKGHIFVIDTALKFCEKLIIAIGSNREKKYYFTLDERLNLLHKTLESKRSSNIKIIAFEGLAVHEAERQKAEFLIRGVRNEKDFSYEMHMSNVNVLLQKKLKTIFIPSQTDVQNLSSSIVKEIFFMGGDISSFVPEDVLQALKNKFKNYKGIQT